ncbi:molybdate transport repressor ModE-like protein [Actinoalloteichus hoggarensis]|uniref:HTH-type transcriptional regulator CysL n=1 Tax=Actinoalloteichus hoggarensis TaxID=1470176 RepID=A0A221W335_9PSEU|nr:LysR family transcriptional regulator [Actinoalloteichus hoggarensis]ASO20144.1 HTH-type transcriptional regulator CysL [Actinoalloteichus hoggarensis]MBB5919143.1 molybdate transport repressor ModE-like protein [Actinoalloteichus hoggarensis]
MTDVPDLRSLRLLVAVGEHGSLGRAAAQLRVSQPSASKRLALMERQLGLALVDRTRRGSTLTPGGTVVVDWARRVLDEFDGLITGARALRATHRATLRVAASMTVAEHLAPGWFGELRTAAPDLYAGLRVTNSETVAELVRSGGVDLGFVESPSAPTGLTARRVGADRLAVVVAPGHPWARRRTPLDAGELSAAPLVVREAGSGTRETLDRALARAGAGPATVLLELGSTTAVRSAVVAGAGPAVLSVLAVAVDLREGRLVEVAVTGVELRRTLRAVWPAGRRLVGPPADLLAIALRAGARSAGRAGLSTAD